MKRECILVYGLLILCYHALSFAANFIRPLQLSDFLFKKMFNISLYLYDILYPDTLSKIYDLAD